MFFLLKKQSMSNVKFEFKSSDGQWAIPGFRPLFEKEEWVKFKKLVSDLSDEAPIKPKLLQWEKSLSKLVSFSYSPSGPVNETIGWWMPYSWRKERVQFDPRENGMHPLPTPETLGWIGALELYEDQKAFLDWLDHNEQGFRCGLSNERKREKKVNEVAIREAKKDGREPYLIKITSPFVRKKDLLRLLADGASIQPENNEDLTEMSSFVLYQIDEGYLDFQDNIRALASAKLYSSFELAEKKKNTMGQLGLEVMEVKIQLNLEKITHKKDLGHKIQSILAEKEANELKESTEVPKKHLSSSRRM